jgi:hypothetical protein
MGLDSYLYRRGKTKKGKILNAMKPKDEYGYEEEIGYWRKANHIHRWFVDKCGKGIDECQDIICPKKQLEKFLKILKKVKQEHKRIVSKKLLPTASGFFFGSTAYDNYYYENVEDAIKIIKKVLEETDFKNEKIVYGASW